MRELGGTPQEYTEQVAEMGRVSAMAEDGYINEVAEDECVSDVAEHRCIGEIVASRCVHWVATDGHKCEDAEDGCSSVNAVNGRHIGTLAWSRTQ